MYAASEHKLYLALQNCSYICIPQLFQVTSCTATAIEEESFYHYVHHLHHNHTADSLSLQRKVPAQFQVTYFSNSVKYSKGKMVPWNQIHFKKTSVENV